MRVLILGAAGMLGHILLRVLARDPRYQVLGTIRGSCDKYPELDHFHGHLIEQVDITNRQRVTEVLKDANPQAVINCVAMRSVGSSSEELVDFIYANALWPHQLASEANNIGARLCHISSDGVFSGSRGQYSEADQPDPSDRYGVAKLLGEPFEPHCISLRTSIIGPELGCGSGLLSWFLAQNTAIHGYARWLYSGVTTLELSSIIADHILPRPQLTGVYHVGGTPISKFALLKLVAQIYDHVIDINDDYSIIKDRTLDSSRFTSETGYRPPNWKTMLCNLRDFK